MHVKELLQIQAIGTKNVCRYRANNCRKLYIQVIMIIWSPQHEKGGMHMLKIIVLRVSDILIIMTLDDP